MKHLLICCISILLLQSCQKSNAIEMVVEPVNSNLEDLHRELSFRFKRYAFPNTLLEIDKAKNQIKITGVYNPGHKKELQRFKAHFENNSFEFCDAYLITDPSIQQLLDSIPEIDGLDYNVGFLYPSVMGSCSDKERLEPIKNQLHQLINESQNIEFLWSTKAESITHLVHQNAYFLYAIKNRENHPSNITDQNITGANVSINNDIGKPEINISLDQSGTKLWAKMTTNAYNKGGRSIALVFNNKVFSAPTVMSPITTGKLSMNGDFDEEEASVFCDKLIFGSLKNQLKIVSENITPLD